MVLEKTAGQPNFQLTKTMESGVSKNIDGLYYSQRMNYVNLVPQTVNGKIDPKRLIAEVNPQ